MFLIEHLKNIYICFTASLLFFAAKAFSQPRADSLAALIKTTSANPKQLASYIELTELLSTKNFEECIAVANKGIKLAASNKDSVSIARLQHNEGNAYYFKGSYDTAALLFYSAINILEKKDKPTYLAYTYNDLAKLYRKKRNLKRASEKFLDEAGS